MKHWSKRLLVLSNLILTIPCISLSADEIASSWEIVWANDLINDCYSLSGVYQSLGDVHTKGSVNIFPARLEASIFGVDNLEVSAFSVNIDQKMDLPLALSVNDREGNAILHRTFNAPYSCEKPWVVYGSNIEGSGDGSSVLSTRTITKMARSKTHGLIVSIHTITTSREWLFSRKTDSTESVYRFSEIETLN